MGPAEGERLTAAGCIEDGERFIQEIGAVPQTMRNRAKSLHTTESSILNGSKPHRQDEAPRAEVIHGQYLPSKFQGMTPWSCHDERPQRDSFGRRRDRAEQRERIPGVHRTDTDAIPGEVPVPTSVLSCGGQGDLLGGVSVGSNDSESHDPHLTVTV